MTPRGPAAGLPIKLGCRPDYGMGTQWVTWRGLDGAVDATLLALLAAALISVSAAPVGLPFPVCGVEPLIEPAIVGRLDAHHQRAVLE